MTDDEIQLLKKTHYHAVKCEYNAGKAVEALVICKMLLVLLFIVIAFKTFVIVNRVDKLNESITRLEETLAKHSVHPEFGNYVKSNEITGRKCHPWDDCR